MKRYLRIAAIAVLVLVFGVAGITKLVDPSLFNGQFAQFGLPQWWVTVTGAVELLGAVLIALFKRMPRRLGAAMLAATMAVALALHLLHDPLALALPAVVLMLIAGFVALVPRRPDTTRELPSA